MKRAAAGPIVLVALALAMPSHAAGFSLPPGYSLDEAVWGGDFVEPSFAIARFIVGLESASKEDGETYYCTGVLIDPRVVISGIDCAMKSGGGETGAYFFVDGYGQFDLQRRTVIRQLYPEDEYDEAAEQYGAEENPFDFGLYLLEEPAPESAGVMDLPAEGFDSSFLPSVEVAGFGGPNYIDGFDTFDEYAFRNALQTASWSVTGDSTKKVLVLKSDQQQLCPGDNGAPAFGERPDGTMLLLGTAIGQGDASDASGYRCSDATNFVNISAWTAWIHKWMPSLFAGKVQ